MINSRYLQSEYIYLESYPVSNLNANSLRCLIEFDGLVEVRKKKQQVNQIWRFFKVINWYLKRGES